MAVFVKKIISRKEFSYKNGETNLNFTLQIDNSLELKSFKKCLEEAIRDVDEILKGMKN